MGPASADWRPPTMVELTPNAATTEPTTSFAAPPPAPTPPRRPRRWGRRIALGAALATAMVGAGVVGAVINEELDREPVPPQRASSVALDVGAVRDGELPAIDVAAVADHLAPSVVTISADIESDVLGGPGGSVGTGVITTADGEILTNAHVVEDATEIRVRLTGETEPRQAELLAIDPGNDLALIRIAGDDFVPATFAEPESVRIGDEVVAIGFALDLDGAPSVTLGIVSALDRTITIGEDGALDGLIQTDAAISSGNSGGPLVNSLGQVVGINTAVARGDFTTAATNIGFAISVEEVLRVVEQLREQATGTVRDEGFLGVSLGDRRDGGQGALIGTVEPDSPAEAAGLVDGDIVIAVDGNTVDGAAGLVAAIRDREPGDEVEITLIRAGETVTVTATLTDRPET
jgi:S1-C subfamily serine protease